MSIISSSADNRLILWDVSSLMIPSLLNCSGPFKRIKLFLVGDGKAGKTSVVRWLNGEPFEEKHIRTEGASISTREMRNFQTISIDHREFIANAIKFKLSNQQTLLGNGFSTNILKQ